MGCFLQIGIWIKNGNLGGTWVAQPVEQVTLNFGSGHDLGVHETEPCIGFHVASAWDSLPLSLYLSPLPHPLPHPLPALSMHTHMWSLSQNKHKKRERNGNLGEKSKIRTAKL